MAWFVNIGEFKVVHNDLHLAITIEELARDLKKCDQEFESLHKSLVKQKLDVLKKQHQILVEIAKINIIRRVRIEGEYKLLRNQIQDTLKESKHAYSTYQADIQKHLNNLAKMKDVPKEQLIELTNQHNDSNRKLSEFTQEVKELDAELVKFQDTVREGGKQDLQGGKVILHNS